MAASPDRILLNRPLPDLAATEALAAALAARARAGDRICLWGELGAGKTTFARFFLRALGCADEVPSPTFNLVLIYDTPAGEVWHFDLYRLVAPEEAFELGIEEAFAGAVSLIEWPDRLGPLLPGSRLDVTLEGEPARRAVLRAHGEAAARFADLADDDG